jgi:hypothetical protein
VLLREVLEWDIASPWKSLVQSPTYGLHATFTNGEGDNGADNDATDATKSNTFKKQLVAKKCHRCHLFSVQYPGLIAGKLPSWPHSRGVRVDSIPVLSSRRYV